MSTYDMLRHFADSWMLLALTLFFIAVVLFVFRAGSAEQYEHMSRIPLADDTKVKTP